MKPNTYPVCPKCGLNVTQGHIDADCLSRQLSEQKNRVKYFADCCLKAMKTIDEKDARIKELEAELASKLIDPGFTGSFKAQVASGPLGGVIVRPSRQNRKIGGI
jgi:hypothetical protein